MGAKQIDQLIHVKGCTVYCAPNDIPEEFPTLMDNEVDLPTIEHPTTTVQMMGDTDIPDQTRVNSMTTVFYNECGLLSAKMSGYSVQSYVVRWAQEMKQADGSFRLVPYVAYVSGMTQSDGGTQVQPGNNITSQLNLNTLKYRLLYDGKEIKYVDKLKGILRLNGKDFREELNSYL